MFDIDGIDLKQLAYKLAEGARAQVARDNRRIDALMKLPCHVYHVAKQNSSSSITQHGLLSSQKLCELVGKENSSKFLRTQRIAYEYLDANIVLRDQRPMPEKALLKCLIDISPANWYELLNTFVFFWFDRKRAETIQSKYKDSVLLTFDLRKLLHYYGHAAYFTPINTGCTAYSNARRGRETFVPYMRWVEDRWASEEAIRGSHRKKVPAPVELAIKDSVRNVPLVLVAEDSLHE